MKSLAFIAAVISVMPLWAGVDDDWRDYYSSAIRSAALKDYVKAEGAYGRALHAAEIFGKDDPRVASTLQGLATLQRTEKS